MKKMKMAKKKTINGENRISVSAKMALKLSLI
jgi:hypothetical protein